MKDQDCELFARRLEKALDDEVFLNPRYSLEDLSRALLTNTSYASAFIREWYGRNFNSVMNLARLRYAERYAAELSMTLRDIALQSGFSSYGNMLRACVRELGTTPDRWRKDIITRICNSKHSHNIQR